MYLPEMIVVSGDVGLEVLKGLPVDVSPVLAASLRVHLVKGIVLEIVIDCVAQPPHQ